jgi:hypothetical protein
VIGRIIKIEENARKRARRQITADEFGALLAETLTERFGALTGADREQVAEAPCGFDAPDLHGAAHVGRRDLVSAPSFPPARRCSPVL